MATASVIVSIMALIVSTVVAVRQFRLARGAAHLNLGVDVLSRCLDGDYAESERIVNSELPAEAVPMVDLPGDVNRHAYRVATLYQMVGYLSAIGSTDRQNIRFFFGVNAVRAWKSLEPHILAQRETYPSLVGYRFFEDLAARSSEADFATAIKLFRLRSMP